MKLIVCKYFKLFLRNLEEREKLTERVRNLEIRILEKDEEMKVLLRRSQLDSKNFKSQVSIEQNKNKELLIKLEKTTNEVRRQLIILPVYILNSFVFLVIFKCDWKIFTCDIFTQI